MRPVSYTHLDVYKRQVNWSSLKIEEYKKNVTKKIVDFLFESSAYKNFAARLKNELDDIINQSGGLLTDKANKLGGKIGDTGTKEPVSYTHLKHAVKQLGETASAKLIFPLMLMFFAVLLIVITPAIMQFSKGF